MRSLLIGLLGLLVTLAGCAGGDRMRDADVDIMFRRTDAVSGDILTLTTPALVSKVNGAYEIEGIAFNTGAALDADGSVTRGENRVFSVRFVDMGDISVLRTDDKRVSLRAELGPDGQVVNALLGSTSGAVHDGFVSYGNDVFENGTWEIMYDGPDIVVGRIDLKFQKYRVQGNFRAPRLRP